MKWGRRERSDIDRREEELAHIRIEADRLIEEGVPASEAMARARARFGSSPDLDPTDRSSRIAWKDLLARDIRYAFRQLVSTPVSTATIVGSLIIGIGVNTAIFSIADQVLVRPLPVSAPDEIVQLRWEGQFIGEGRGWGDLLPHPLYVAVRGGSQVFTSIAARSPGEVTLVTPAGPERAQVALVTGGFFEMLGLHPHAGRLIDESDDRVLGGHPVVVLSHAWWTARFGADPAVVGRQIQMNGQPMTVIGVAPEGFHGTDWSEVPAAWTPMMMNGLVHEWGRLDQPRVRFQHVYARLAPGVSRADAEASLQPWFGRYLQVDMEGPDWPSDLQPAEVSAYLGSRLALRPGGQGQAARAGELTEPVLILIAATALLLLLACLNVANLSLARAVARYRDTAVRTALGASRGRIMTERLVESALVAVIGGALGIAITPLVGAWILEYLGTGSSGMAIEATLDARTLLVALLVAAVATVLSGVGPAWFASSTHPMGVLRGRDGSSGVRLRRALVVGQVALALVLLMGAGLFGKTLSTLESGGPGFETNQLVTLTLNPGNEGYTPVETKVIMGEIAQALATIPGVRQTGLAAWPLLGGSGWGNSMLVEADERFVTDLYLPMNAVTPSFFDMLGVRVVRGRDFTESDRTSGDLWSWESVIVSQSFVDRYLPDRDPLGVRIDFGRDPSVSARMEIVGVVEDYAEHQLRDPMPQVYFPYWTQIRDGGSFYLRTQVPLDVVAPEIRARIAAIDPGLTISGLRSLDEQIDRLLVFERMLASLGAAFALFGTLLAMIGIYGVLSFSVESRTKEMGIRMALGAPGASASRLIISDAFRLTALGVAVALPSIWFLGGLIESQLYGVSPMNPVGLLVSTSVILLVCLAASAIPAWRMAKTDPLEAFRVE